MYLQSLSTASPEVSYTQNEVWDIFTASSVRERLRPGSIELVRKLLTGNNGIEQRHFSLYDFEQLLHADGEGLNHAFEAEAPKLAGEALKKALHEASWKASELDGLIVCSCTGYLCPGLSSFIAEQQGLRPDIYMIDLVGQGCGAAIPSMRAASHFLTARPSAKVAVISVEVCTAAFYIDDEAGVLVSFCIFGDGAAASLWTGTESGGTGYRASNFNSIHLPENREILRFENSRGMLRNKLHSSIPEQSSKAVARTFAASYPNGNRPDAIISHGGGVKVLDALEETLPGYRFPESRKVLREHGNMSSPSVLFALKEHLDASEQANHLWLTSFGAGFTVYGSQLSR